jgi:hypothetical protein
VLDIQADQAKIAFFMVGKLFKLFDLAIGQI